MDVKLIIGLVEPGEVDATVADLRQHGVMDEDIVVRTAAHGRYEVADELLQQDAKGASWGGIAGATIGAVAGVAVAPIVTDMALIESMPLVGVVGAGFGFLVGAMTGLERRDRLDGDPVEFLSVTDDRAVIEVHTPHRRGPAHASLERHHAVIVRSGEPVSA